MKVTNAGIGAVVLMLVVTGIADAFHRSTTAGLAFVGALGVFGLFAWISRGSAIRGRNQRAPLLVYTFAAAGLVYLARFWIHGSL